MLIKNKLEKFLLALSGFSAAALVIMGFKVQDDASKIENLIAATAAPDTQPDRGLALQSAIQNSRDSKLNAAAHAPLVNSNTTTTIKTVIPGKTITQTVPSASSSSSKSSSSSNSSSSKKTTKTS